MNQRKELRVIDIEGKEEKKKKKFENLKKKFFFFFVTVFCLFLGNCLKKQTKTKIKRLIHSFFSFFSFFSF